MESSVNMSSVQMAADSTQGGYKDKKRSSKETTQKRRSDTSRDRYSKKKKKYKHYSDDEYGSDEHSDLDLAKDLFPIGAYIKKRHDMVDQMFHSISSTKLKAMLPHILKGIPPEKLKEMCVEQVDMMSKKRIVRILQGGDPEAISSTDEDDDSTEAEADEADGSTGDISESASVADEPEGQEKADWEKVKIKQELVSGDEVEEDQGSATDMAEEQSSPYPDDVNMPNQSRTPSPAEYQSGETAEVRECQDVKPQISDSGARVSSPTPSASQLPEKPAPLQPAVIRKVKKKRKKKPARSLEDMEEGEILTDDDQDDEEYDETESVEGETNVENERDDGEKLPESQIQEGQDLVITVITNNDADKEADPEQISEHSSAEKKENSMIHTIENLNTTAELSPGMKKLSSVAEPYEKSTQQGRSTDSNTTGCTKPEITRDVKEIKECDGVKQDTVAVDCAKKDVPVRQMQSEDKETDLTVIKKEDIGDQKVIAKSDVISDNALERDDVDHVVATPEVNKNTNINQLSKTKPTVITKKDLTVKKESDPSDSEIPGQLKAAVVSKQKQVESSPPKPTVVRPELAKPKTNQLGTLSTDQMEILELEMRARAIKAMLRTQGAKKQALRTKMKIIQRPAKPN